LATFYVFDRESPVTGPLRSPRAKTFEGLLSSFGRTLKLFWRSARTETFEGFLAKYVWVALTGFGKLYDALRDNAVEIVVVCKPKRYPSHLECDTHDALGLRVEPGAV
jgi:hypothetical protein